MQLAFAIFFGLIIPLIDQITLALVLGSATFGLIYYFRAYKDGKLTKEEEGFLEVVKRVLKGSILTQIIIQGLSVSVGLYAYFSAPNLYQDIGLRDFYIPILLIAIVLVAFLIKKNEISKAMAPAIAGSLWYAYFIARQIQEVSLLNPIQFLAVIVLWGSLFVLIFDAIKKNYWKRKSSK